MLKQILGWVVVIFVVLCVIAAGPTNALHEVATWMSNVAGFLNHNHLS